MKITLDLTELVATGKLTREEAERLKALAAHDTGTLAINLLVGFGLVAVAAGIAALIPSAVTGIVLGAMLLMVGFGLLKLAPAEWDLLGRICIVIGALALCGGLAVLDDGRLRIMIADAALLAAAGVLARSGLLVAAAVLTVGLCLGSSTDYRHALYSIDVEQPTLTILIFGIIAVACYALSLGLAPAYERLALIAARVAVLMVNVGFWVGSLWGDDLSWLRTRATLETISGSVAHTEVLPPGVFALVWSVALLGVGIWAVRVNRRWVVNLVAVFGAVDFYTQWFERLGADPSTVLMAGLITLAVALALFGFNRRRQSAAHA